MLPLETQQAIKAICNNYSRIYWRLDRRDMEQEATMAALKAARTWSPTDGTPLHCYQARAAVLAVRRYCTKAVCPVSGCENIRDTLTIEELPLYAVEETADGFASPEGHYYRNRLAAEIRRILYGLPDGRLASLVLLDEYKPAEVAREERCKLRRVYRATTRAYQALAASPTLQMYAAEAA